MNRLRVKDGFIHEKLITLPLTSQEWYQENPLTKDLYPSALGFFPHAGHHYFERTEGIPEFIVIFCIEGKGCIDLCGLQITLEAGEVYIIPEKTPHSYQADLINPWSIYWCHFQGTLAKRYTELVQPDLTKIQLLPGQHPHLFRYFDEMIAILESGYSRDHLYHTSSLLKIFFTNLNHTSYNHSKAGLSQAHHSAGAIEWMQQHLGDSITVNQLADTLGLSVSHLQHLFHEKTGHSPMAYFTSLKMQKACQQLSSSDIPVKAIARQLGYEDPYYFSRVFKKTVGQSPRAYRKSF